MLLYKTKLLTKSAINPTIRTINPTIRTINPTIRTIVSYLKTIQPYQSYSHEARSTQIYTTVSYDQKITNYFL